MSKKNIAATLLVATSLVGSAYADISEPLNAINEFSAENNLKQLYQEGMVVPNQPLAMPDAQRKILRDKVQELLDSRSAGGMRMNGFERETLNAILFNYGLQALEDGRVIIIDVFVPNQQMQGNGMLSPNVELPKGAVVLTPQNAEHVLEQAKLDNLRSEQARKAEAQKSKQADKIFNTSDDYGKEFNY